MATKPAAFSVKVSAPQTDDQRPVSQEDFCRYLKQPNAYFFIPCRELWPSSSVNARLPPVPVLDKNGQPKLDNKGKPMTVPATAWIDANRCVEQATWHPGMPLYIPDKLAVAGGWIEKKGTRSFNLYRPPRIALGDASKATPWVNHVHQVYPNDATHIIRFLAHRRQHPGEKINHALFLGGVEGIGKDSIMEPVKQAVGPWNFHETSPKDLFGPFNDFAKSVILRINEGRDLGEIDRFKFHDHLKIYAAAPPDTLRVNEKHLREYYVLNCLGLVITTNHLTDGLYLPATDRRHYVAWSECQMGDFTKDYWNKLWGFYYYEGGFEHVAAYLAEYDLSSFDPKEPPPKTPAFWQIVHANTAPEDTELADLLETLNDPRAVTLEQLIAKANGDIAEWLMDRNIGARSRTASDAAVTSRCTIPTRRTVAGWSTVKSRSYTLRPL